MFFENKHYFWIDSLLKLDYIWYLKKKIHIFMFFTSAPAFCDKALISSYKYSGTRLQTQAPVWHWGGALYLLINFELDFQPNCWDFGLEKNISFRIVKIMNNFCIFNNLNSRAAQIFFYLMIVDNFFLVHFCLLFMFLSPQHFGQCQTGACT